MSTRPSDCRPLCVLGPMRTGTSLIAGVLQRLGVNFGDESELLPANRANPSGFTEHTEIIAINDALLERLGGSWARPPSLPRGWTHARDLADLRARAERVIEGLARAPRWGWKDPRTCLTLAFWTELAPPPIYFLCLRDPRAAAQSLIEMPWAARRLEGRVGLALEVWHRYMSAAEIGTRGAERAFVRPLDLRQDPRKFVSLADRAGLGEAVAHSATGRAVHAFVRPSQDEPRVSTAALPEPAVTRAMNLYAELEPRVLSL